MLTTAISLLWSWEGAAVVVVGGTTAHTIFAYSSVPCTTCSLRLSAAGVDVVLVVVGVVVVVVGVVVVVVVVVVGAVVVVVVVGAGGVGCKAWK